MKHIKEKQRYIKDTVRRCSMYLIRVLEGGNRENGEMIVARNFLELWKDWSADLGIAMNYKQEKSKEYAFRHITGETAELQRKSAKMDHRKAIRLTADFSTATMEARRKWIFQCAEIK